MIFFFDRCFPVMLCAAVKALEHGTHDVIYHDDRFDQNTPDTDWIHDVGQWPVKPIVVSADGRILKRPAERDALIAQDLMWFCLADGWTNLAFRDMTWKFFKVWPHVVEEATKVRKPTVFKISCSTSKVEVFSETKGLKK